MATLVMSKCATMVLSSLSGFICYCPYKSVGGSKYGVLHFVFNTLPMIFVLSLTVSEDTVGQLFPFYTVFAINRPFLRSLVPMVTFYENLKRKKKYMNPKRNCLAIKEFSSQSYFRIHWGGGVP